MFGRLMLTLIYLNGFLLAQLFETALYSYGKGILPDYSYKASPKISTMQVDEGWAGFWIAPEKPEKKILQIKLLA